MNILAGPSPDIDVVLSVLLQSTLPVAQNAGKAGGASELSGVGKSGLNQNGSVHRPPRERRKDAGSKQSLSICLCDEMESFVI
jgi:cleavage stimulation factor subunit 3